MNTEEYNSALADADRGLTIISSTQYMEIQGVNDA